MGDRPHGAYPLNPLPAQDNTQRPPSPWALFKAFNALAMQGFGGVLPLAQRELVERRGWVTRDDFLQLLSVGQVLPGPNVVNLALMLGDRFFGWRGAVAALGGLLLLPVALVLALAALYGHLADHPMATGALRGMGAASAGLILAMALKLLPALARNPIGRAAAGAAVLGTLVLAAALRWPLVWVVATVGLPTIAWAAWRLRQQGNDDAVR